MTGRRNVAMVLIVVLVGAAGWRILSSRGEAQAEGPTNMLTFSWSGKDAGQTKLPIELTWCPTDRTARLFAVSNDTGVAIVFHERDSLQLVPHAVTSAGLPAPQPLTAVVGARWPRDKDTVLAGFTSQSGTVMLTGTSSQSVSGSFELTLQRVNVFDTVHVKGSFSNIPVVIKQAGCP